MTASLDDLLSLRFFGSSSARGYTTAGSFVRFLLDRYGAPAVRTLYHSGGDFDGAFGKPRAALEGEWIAMIQTIVLPPESVESSKERFRRGGMFSRPCPHAIAARHERAAARLADNDRPGAILELRDVCADAPDEPQYKLELADALMRGTELEQVEAEVLWKTVSTDDESVTPTVRVEALDRLARLATARGDVALRRTLIDAARALPIEKESSARRQLDAEVFALDYTGPAGDALRGYFFDAKQTPREWAQAAIVAEPNLGFPHYLAGLQAMLVAPIDYATAARELDRGLALGLPGLGYAKNGARRLALAAFRAGDRSRLGDAIAYLSSSDMSTADHLLAIDWQQRMIFASR